MTLYRSAEKSWEGIQEESVEWAKVVEALRREMDLEQARAAVQRAAEAQREAERHLDHLSALVDRMTLQVNEASDFESPKQKDLVAKATGALEAAVKEGLKPTAGGLRESENPYDEAARAVVEANAVLVEHRMDGMDTDEALEVEDRAGWLLGQMQMEDPFTPTARQLEMAVRVGRRMERTIQRERDATLPPAVVEEMKSFKDFKRGDIIPKTRGQERHRYSKGDRVRIVGERDSKRQEGYVCRETRCQVRVLDREGKPFQKNKENVQYILREPRFSEQVYQHYDEDYLKMMLLRKAQKE